jgi:hypothetical protein
MYWLELCCRRAQGRVCALLEIDFLLLLWHVGGVSTAALLDAKVSPLNVVAT